MEKAKVTQEHMFRVKKSRPCSGPRRPSWRSESRVPGATGAVLLAALEAAGTKTCLFAASAVLTSCLLSPQQAQDYLSQSLRQ